MTPEEKAKDLVNKMRMPHYWQGALLYAHETHEAKECALIAVEEILSDYEVFNAKHHAYKVPTYWLEVKKQIELL